MSLLPSAGRVGPSWVGRQEALLVVLFAALILVFGLIESRFVSSANFSTTAQDAAATAVLAVGLTFVIVTAGIDLSVGAVLGLSGVVAGLAMREITGLGDAPTLLVGGGVAVATGGFCGVLNGLMVVRLRISPFIATLATLGVASGLTLVLTDGINVTDLPGSAARLGNETFAGGFTFPIAVAIAIALVGGLCLHGTQFGRWTYAVGSDRSSARKAGIPVRRHLVGVYALSGALAGAAGMLLVLRLGVASPQAGVNEELTAIAAAVIGGASLFGGVGTILGSVLGALILSVVLSGLIISGVQPYWQLVATGLLIAVAVAFHTATTREEDED